MRRHTPGSQGIREMADTRNPEEPETRAPSNGPATTETHLLPDFCGDETLLRLLIFAILFALLVSLLRVPGDQPLIDTGLVLLFITWVAMSSMLLLCLLQSRLRRLALAWQIATPPVIVVLNTTLVHLGAEYFHLVTSDDRLQVIGVAIVVSLIAMHYLYLIAAWKREISHVAHAREQALRARVRPHFLFNSMNTIVGLIRSDPARAEQITLDLADLFRATFNTAPTHPLSAELELIRAYLAIEQSRFGERLELTYDIAEAHDETLEIPALLLHPLVENAIQHGIAPVPSGGRVWVHAHPDGPAIVIRIGNTFGAQTGPGTHTAGDEARARLRQFFGEQARIDTRQGPNTFEIIIVLPRDPNPAESAP